MEQNQTNRYVAVTVPLSNFRRLNIYFKRFTYSHDKSLDQNLYQAINHHQQIDLEDIEQQIPQKRTLQVVSFQRELVESELKKWFRVAGRIRKVLMGKQQTQLKNQKQKVYFGLVIFTDEKGVNNAFDPELIQNNVNQLNKYVKTKGDDDDEDYLSRLYDKYQKKDDQDQAKQKFIQQMESDGFTLVTGNDGDIDMNQVHQQQPQQDENDHYRRKKKKKVKEKTDFYKFQVKKNKIIDQIEDQDDVDVSQMSFKELISFQKMQLQKKFEQDKQMLIKKKIKKD